VGEASHPEGRRATCTTAANQRPASCGGAAANPSSSPSLSILAFVASFVMVPFTVSAQAGASRSGAEAKPSAAVGRGRPESSQIAMRDRAPRRSRGRSSLCNAGRRSMAQRGSRATGARARANTLAALDAK